MPTRSAQSWTKYHESRQRWQLFHVSRRPPGRLATGGLPCGFFPETLLLEACHLLGKIEKFPIEGV